LRHVYLSLAIVVVGSVSAATAPAQTKTAAATWTAPKTAWGDPDLQAVWTSDDSIGVPLERPRRYGNRKLLTEEEFAERAQENNKISTSVQAGVNPQAGYWVQHEGVDAEPYSSNWTEYARRTSRQTSLIVDPEDGHLPPLTKEAMFLRAASIAASRKRLWPESWEDLSMNARCITRGVLGSMLPVIYGNGTDILQAPGLVVIRNEMIHETRLVPIDAPDNPRPHLPDAIRTYMGDPRGHWEGDTLVVETTNFTGGLVGIGNNGDGVKYSDNLRLVERLTRTSESGIQYEVTVHDAKTFTASWTVAFPITREPGYQIFEYACHEGNYAMANILSEARAAEKAAATPR
jgi:hypothetical protein